MKQNNIALKTMAIKAKVANFLRKELYNYTDNEYKVKYQKKKSIDDIDSKNFLKTLFPLVEEMHKALNNYKQKRKNKEKLYQKRLSSPQTKTMLKKLKGKIKKNLVESK